MSCCSAETTNWASLVAQLVKNLPAMQDTQIQSLGWDDPLEKGKATHSSILAWPGEFYGLYSPWGRKESDTTDNFCFQSRFGIIYIYIYIYTHTHFVFIEI